MRRSGLRTDTELLIQCQSSEYKKETIDTYNNATTFKILTSYQITYLELYCKMIIETIFYFLTSL